MNLDELYAIFSEHQTEESYKALGVELHSRMVLVRRFAESFDAPFVTLRWNTGLSITCEDGEVTATAPGLVEHAAEGAASAPTLSLQQLENTLCEMGEELGD